ncbi:hypothetical protein PAESOLCIP111_03208 [Paenibacillus solanacearum]|uniref:Uncharacterized protein n=1 Tax=Paenibacillus solanacearum TaxID=2048548 RepID=A0A916K5N5_9BACL|nr:hypothetical protein PAESOLCIP111_03208 [Paenibacillus solanacearum]
MKMNPMFASNPWLVNQADFDNAMFLEIPVTVWRDNRYIDYGGIIIKHNDDAVWIAGDYFLKKEFRFKIRSADISNR